MRKKSHVSLAGFIVKNLDVQDLWKHRKAFYFGSILPDCRFSFLTTKHEFDSTFQMLQERITNLTETSIDFHKKGRSTAIELGEIIHYMADYFTFPHNTHYEGDLAHHCIYENDLKIGLRTYIASGKAKMTASSDNWFVSKEELFAYIERAHAEYVSRARNVEEDCEYIVRVCRQVTLSILFLLAAETETCYA